MLIRKIPSGMPEAERARWQVVRLDTHLPLLGLVLTADVDAGTATMRERDADDIAPDGKRTPRYKDVDYALGERGIAIRTR